MGGFFCVEDPPNPPLGDGNKWSPEEVEQLKPIERDTRIRLGIPDTGSMKEEN